MIDMAAQVDEAHAEVRPAQSVVQRIAEHAYDWRQIDEVAAYPAVRGWLRRCCGQRMWRVRLRTRRWKVSRFHKHGPQPDPEAGWKLDYHDYYVCDRCHRLVQRVANRVMWS